MNNIQKCPNCIQSATEAYQQGYADAMKLYQDEILNALQSRPIQFVAPKNFVQQPLSGSANATPKCSHDMTYPTDGSKPQCKICGKVAGELL